RDHARAEGRRPAVDPAPAHPAAQREVGHRDAHQHPRADAGGDRAGGVRIQPGAAHLAVFPIDRARHPRHRARLRAALVPDDDHALESRAAGDRLPVDGERAVLRRDQRHLRHAHGGRARHRARRARRDGDPGRLPLPDPRAIRLARHPSPGEAERGLMEALLALLVVPLLGGFLLWMLGERDSAPEANSLFSFGTLAAAVMLTVQVISEGPVMGLSEQFFVDPLNVFLVTLTAFVAFTTSLFSRPYMRTERDKGRMTPGRLRLYHSMYQVFTFTMLLALTTNNMGILWVAMEAATLATVLLVSVYRT